MPIVAAGGLALHVQELGAEGRPVVMLHGLLIGSLASWYFTTGPVLARTHRVMMFDFRGHGRSERVPNGYDVATLADDLAEVTSELLDPFDLVGHSWGGLVALKFATVHPERVRRLVVVEAPLPPSSALEITSFLTPDGGLPARLIDALPAPLREQLASGRRQAERLLRSLEYLVLESTLVEDVRAEPDPSDAVLSAIPCPTLCVYGDRSACAPAGARLARVLPDARLLKLRGGHYLHLDAGPALTSAIVEFLDG
jgi:pimeloyl-ACP methyl ester carboxylesterase